MVSPLKRSKNGGDARESAQLRDNPESEEWLPGFARRQSEEDSAESLRTLEERHEGSEGRQWRLFGLR